MSEKGIKEIKELLSFACDMGNGSGKALEDGKLSWDDAFYFSKAAMSAPPAFMGISQVDDEYFDLNEAERKELKELAAKKLDLPQDKIEGIVESFLAGILEFSKGMRLVLKEKQNAGASS